MATVYFKVTGPAATIAGRTVDEGNYYIRDLSGFTTVKEILEFVGLTVMCLTDMWLQYEDKVVVTLETGKSLTKEELSDFAQAKMVAKKWPWHDKLEFPLGSARYLNKLLHRA
tara:strand:+ start:41 stop:379 length:339 start_codon:yes stop_codon:yes gene_type:complete